MQNITSSASNGNSAEIVLRQDNTHSNDNDNVVSRDENRQTMMIVTSANANNSATAANQDSIEEEKVTDANSARVNAANLGQNDVSMNQSLSYTIDVDGDNLEENAEPDFAVSDINIEAEIEAEDNHDLE